MTHDDFIFRYLRPSVYSNNNDWDKENNVLYVYKNLDLRYRDITSLPDNLHIHGWLCLLETEISSLPDNLYVGNTLVLNNTNITAIPDDLIVGECIFSNIKLSMSKQMQTNLITKDKRNINIIKKPTKTAKTMHKLLWKI